MKTKLLLLMGLILGLSTVGKATIPDEAEEVRCALLNAQNKQTDDFLVLSIKAKESKVIEASSYFNYLSEAGATSLGSPTVCKRPGMTKSPDYENSYQLCGIDISWTAESSQIKDGLSISLVSGFNSQFSDLPDYLKKFTESRSFYQNQFDMPKGLDLEYEIARLESEDGKIGHIYTYGLNGKIVNIKKIQCAPEILKYFIKGANH